MMDPRINLIKGPDGLEIYHLGPPLDEGPRPSVFYFSLSGEESLGLTPYNQPAIVLSQQKIRVFSITLPGHEGTFPHPNAIKEWSQLLSNDTNVIEDFISLCRKCLDFLIDNQFIDPHFIGTAGLSRGSFIATHLAAADTRIQTVLGFAPVTKLKNLKEFENLEKNSLFLKISLDNLISKLIPKTIRYYIGNQDSLVGTANCFSFMHSLANKAYEETHRFPPHELIIYPSVGHKGHGTPPEIFESGALWLAQSLKSLIKK